MNGSKSSIDILQEFVGDLLTEIEAGECQINKQQAVQFNNKQAVQKSALVKALKLTPQPLLSEKLNRAKTLLQAMPDVEDVIEKTVKEAAFPEIIATENFLEQLNDITEDEIIILEESVDEDVDRLTEEIIIYSDAINMEEVVEAEKKIQLPSPLVDGVPEWGRGSFQTLIFNIGELKLALPLIKLGGIHRLEPEPTPMPESAPWYLGLIADEFGSISVIDTALWIMPDKYDIAVDKGLDYQFFVLLDDTRWGLACSKVDNAITLSEDDVRWNSKNSKRPWLAGMLVDEMCALLDVNTLIRMLDGNATSTT